MFDKGPERVRLEGRILGVGFASGDRFVAGIWDDGPLGPMVDVMWANRHGSRTLLASSAAVTAFVGGIYEFERTEVVSTSVQVSSNSVRLRAGELELDATVGRPSALFALRPKPLRRSTWWVRVENALFRPLFGQWLIGGGTGVRLYGTSPSGVKEWYCIDSYRPLQRASATIAGRDLGEMARLEPPAGFGFSEFPPQPALVQCAPVLQGAARFLIAPAEDV